MLLSSLLTTACNNSGPAAIPGTVTNIHYVTWEQASVKPDAVFIQLDNDKEYRFSVRDRLPLQRGQRVLVRIAARAPTRKRRIQPACAIIPLNAKDKPLTPLILKADAHCH
jgi:hypothetical protein